MQSFFWQLKSHPLNQINWSNQTFKISFSKFSNVALARCTASLFAVSDVFQIDWLNNFDIFQTYTHIHVCVVINGSSCCSPSVSPLMKNPRCSSFVCFFGIRFRFRLCFVCVFDDFFFFFSCRWWFHKIRLLWEYLFSFSRQMTYEFIARTIQTFSQINAFCEISLEFVCIFLLLV